MFSLFSSSGPQLPTLILDIGLMGILVVVAFAIVRLRSLFAIVMLQGVYSLISAAWFVSLDAVDVAFTEAAVGAGVSTVLMLAAMLLVDRKSNAVPVSKQIAPLLIVVVAGIAMFYAIPDMPAYGDAMSPANSYVGADYLARTAEETHIPNVVTAVLASYRGYDTFGEAVVIFAAGLGVLLLLGLNGNAGGWKARPNGQRISAPAAPFAHRDRKPAPPKTDMPETPTLAAVDAADMRTVTLPDAPVERTSPSAFTSPQPKPKTTPKKAPVRKAAAKKATAKKATAKTPATKTPATKTPATKKPATKKPAAKKAPAKKTTAKKAAPKKAAPKKTTTRKTAAKKAAPKKTATKKPATKKPAVKKTAVKKTVAKTTTAKKTQTKRGPGRPRKDGGPS